MSLPINTRIFIAGSKGMVGSALKRLFLKKGYENLLTPSRQELNLCCQNSVRTFLNKEKPDVIVMAAAKVGGIGANMTYPAEFLYENMMMASNLIHEAHKADINRLLFLGSSCIYPKLAPQPIPENALLSNYLEPTNEAYAIAKIAGLKLCQYYNLQYGRQYISAMPTNLYGPQDTYHRENSHVIPALILKMHEAKMKNLKEIAIWGSGEPLREFLYVDDLAEALYFLLQNYFEPTHINVGSHEEISIKDLAKIIAEIVEFKGHICHDLSKPDGTMRKKSDLTKIHSLGWHSKTSLKEGLKLTYADFCNRLLQ